MAETVDAIVLDAFKVSTYGDDRTIPLVKVMDRALADPDLPERSEFMLVVTDEQFEQVEQALMSSQLDELVAVTVDRDDLIPCYSIEPCPLCRAEDQWVKPVIEAALVSKSCDECGQNIVANNLPPELQGLLDTTVDVYEQATGRPFFSTPTDDED